jgi:hypothetical protein
MDLRDCPDGQKDQTKAQQNALESMNFEPRICIQVRHVFDPAPLELPKPLLRVFVDRCLSDDSSNFLPVGEASAGTLRTRGVGLSQAPRENSPTVS